MKLKYDFVVRDVCGSSVAVAVGDGASAFNGMIKLNSTGAEIMELLASPTTEEQIVDTLTEKYKADKSEVASAVASFLKTLRDSGVIEDRETV